MARKTEMMQDKIILLLKGPIGINLESAQKLFLIFGEINSIAQKLEEEGKHIRQEHRSSEKKICEH